MVISKDMGEACIVCRPRSKASTAPWKRRSSSALTSVPSERLAKMAALAPS